MLFVITDMRTARAKRGRSNDALHSVYFKAYYQGGIESSRSRDVVDPRFDSTMRIDSYVTAYNIPAADRLGRIPEHLENTGDNDSNWKSGVTWIRGRENRCLWLAAKFSRSSMTPRRR